MKTLFATVAASFVVAPAAFAGPYVNVETNANWTDKKYTNATTDLHIGYAGGSGKFDYYVQGGPAYVAVKDEDSKTRLSGKAGGNYQFSESFGLYGEVSLLTGEKKEDLGTGGKLGVKYTF